MAERDLSSYIEVATRIADFRRAYPFGSLRGDFRMIQVGEQHLIAYRAEAFRDPADQAPGIGCAWELVPGRTPFTKGSELQNAETSAWGRAIIAVGASDSKAGIASREEVAARRAEREPERGYEPCAVRNASGVACGLPKGHDQQPGPAGLHGWEAGALPRNADGSLSRSRTSDEEKAAAGVMTEAQLKAHNKTRRDGEPAPGRVEKVSGSDLDQWQVDPGHWAAGALPPEDQPGSSTPQQRQHLALKLAEIGLASPEQGRAWCSEQLGREIATRKDLSLVEGRRLLDVVDKVIDANRKAAKASG